MHGGYVWERGGKLRVETKVCGVSTCEDNGERGPERVREKDC